MRTLLHAEGCAFNVSIRIRGSGVCLPRVRNAIPCSDFSNIHVGWASRAREDAHPIESLSFDAACTALPVASGESFPFISFIRIILHELRGDEHFMLRHCVDPLPDASMSRAPGSWRTIRLRSCGTVLPSYASISAIISHDLAAALAMRRITADLQPKRSGRCLEICMREPGFARCSIATKISNPSCERCLSKPLLEIRLP